MYVQDEKSKRVVVQHLIASLLRGKKGYDIGGGDWRKGFIYKVKLQVRKKFQYLDMWMLLVLASAIWINDLRSLKNYLPEGKKSN